METSDFLDRNQTGIPDTHGQMETSDLFCEPAAWTPAIFDLESEFVAGSEVDAEADLYHDSDSDSDVEQTERENNTVLNMIMEYELN